MKRIPCCSAARIRIGGGGAVAREGQSHQDGMIAIAGFCDVRGKIRVSDSRHCDRGACNPCVSWYPSRSVSSPIGCGSIRKIRAGSADSCPAAAARKIFVAEPTGCNRRLPLTSFDFLSTTRQTAPARSAHPSRCGRASLAFASCRSERFKRILREARQVFIQRKMHIKFLLLLPVAISVRRFPRYRRDPEQCSERSRCVRFKRPFSTFTNDSGFCEKS